MFFKKVSLCLIATAFLSGISGCQEDMLPSNKDERKSVEAGSEGSRVGQVISDFSASLSTGDTYTLSEQLATHDAVVLYFTMWCPVCSTHMRAIDKEFEEEYENIDFVFVDYLSNSISSTRSTQSSQGWKHIPTISDFDNHLENMLQGNMAITVIIDKNFIVQFNEEYKDDRLLSVLNSL